MGEEEKEIEMLKKVLELPKINFGIHLQNGKQKKV